MCPSAPCCSGPDCTRVGSCNAPVPLRIGPEFRLCAPYLLLKNWLACRHVTHVSVLSATASKDELRSTGMENHSIRQGTVDSARRYLHEGTRGHIGNQMAARCVVMVQLQTPSRSHGPFPIATTFTCLISPFTSVHMWLPCSYNGCRSSSHLPFHLSHDFVRLITCR